MRDEEEVVREALALRPLAMQCTDLKAICAAGSHALKLGVCRSAHAAQRGFVPGRRLRDNVLDLEAHGRMLALAAPLTRLPVAVFWDFLVACPSLDHGYRLELEEWRLPAGLVDFVRRLYDHNRLYWRG